MKFIIGLLVMSAVSSPLFAAKGFPQISLNAKDVFRIEVGTDDEDYMGTGDKISFLMERNRELTRRIYRLEMALRQMQDQVYSLATMPAPVAITTKEHTCFIKTTFNGTVSGKGDSEMEAKANALKSCDQAGGGFSCEERNVKCGS